MKLSNNHDDLPVKEILLFEPHTYKHRTCRVTKSSKATSIQLYEKINHKKKSIRDRYNLLAAKHKKKRKNEERSSGISPEDSELSKGLQDLEERFEQADSEFAKLANWKKSKSRGGCC